MEDVIEILVDAATGTAIVGLSVFVAKAEKIDVMHVFCACRVR